MDALISEVFLIAPADMRRSVLSAIFLGGSVENCL
jgi:hypothetical protein